MYCFGSLEFIGSHLCFPFLCSVLQKQYYFERANVLDFRLFLEQRTELCSDKARCNFTKSSDVPQAVLRLLDISAIYQVRALAFPRGMSSIVLILYVPPTSRAT